MRSLTTLSALIIVLNCAATASAQHLHAILVGDTDASDITWSIRPQLDRLERTLEVGLPRGQVTVTILTGRQVTADGITRRLRTLRINANQDAVLFFYAGHGGFDSNRGHYLDLSNGRTLYRAELEEAMTQPATPRFWAMITNSCAVDIAAAPLPPEVDRTRLLTHLFFETDGCVDFNSCRPGQVAWGDLFTRNFCDVLDENCAEALDWDEVFNLTRERTALEAENLSIDGVVEPYSHLGIQQQTQTVYSFKEIDGVNVNGRRLGIELDGAVIIHVDEDSPAAEAGLTAGMKVHSINGQRVSASEQVTAAINSSRREAELVVDTDQGRRPIPVTLAY